MDKSLCQKCGSTIFKKHDNLYCLGILLLRVEILEAEKAEWQGLVERMVKAYERLTEISIKGAPPKSS